MKKNNEELKKSIIEKWGKADLLDGLEGNVPENLGKMFESEISYTIKEKRSTIRDAKIYAGRMQGNSTRQIDLAIDLFYSGFIVEVMDHHKNGDNKRLNKVLFDRILDRLQAEHRLDLLIKNKKIKIDRKNLTLELNN